MTDLDATWLDRIDACARLPGPVQAYVRGTDIRVRVIGDRWCATAMGSSATDYRYVHRRYERARCFSRHR